MNIKTIIPLFLLLISPTITRLAGAEEGAEEYTALRELAATKRAAALKFTYDVGTAGTANFFGAFISRDGLALVALQVTVLDKKPTVETTDGKPLRFGTILKLFPEQGVALMKFNHHPKVIVPLANEGPELGETIAFLPLRNNADWPGKLPSIVGPILVKRRDISTDLKVPRFIEVLSIGSGLPRGQHDIGSVGGYAINANGDLIGVMSGVRPYPGQTLITLRSIATLANEVEQLANEGKGLEFPLPEAAKPIDPALNDPEYMKLNEAMMRQDPASGLRLIESLLKRYPKSFVIRFHAATNPFIGDADKPLLGLEDFPEPDPDDLNKAYQYSLHGARGAILLGRDGNENFERAIREIKAAIECSPADLPEARAQLAEIYLDEGRLADAEKLCRAAYPYMSDTIVFIEQFEKLLTQQGKIDEADKMSNRLFDLLEIYRQR